MLKENDVAIIYVQEIPSGFIRIDDVQPDDKQGWWLITFTKLEFPLQAMTWKLDDDHVNGGDIFMKGVRIKIQAIQRVKTEVVPKDPNRKIAKVLSMADWVNSHKIKEIPQEVA